MHRSITFGAGFDDDDLTSWETGFASDIAIHRTGGANTDAAANGLDFLAWQRQFGNAGAAVAASTTIPEPFSLLLATFGLITLSAWRRRA